MKIRGRETDGQNGKELDGELLKGQEAEDEMQVCGQ